jgi:hypothetical protein
MAARFVATADGHGGTLIVEGSQVENQQPLLTQPHVQYEGGPAQGVRRALPAFLF